MKVRRVIASVGKALVLLLMLTGVFYYLRIRQPQDVIDDAADDLLEQVGDTYVPVHATTITQKTMHRFITAYGRVEPAPASINGPAALQTITAPMPAIVNEVNCIEGQTVQAGQSLFTIDSRALQRAVVADQTAATSAHNRRDQLFADQSTPAWVRAQVDHDAEQALVLLDRDKAQLAAMTFSSSIAGTVTHLSISQGSVIDLKRAAVEIVDLHRLVIALDVTAAGLDDVHVGQEAFGTFGKAKVIRVDAAIDPQSGLGSVDIPLTADTSLRPGQSASAQIVVETRDNCLVVPISSVVVDDQNRSMISIIDESSGRWAVRTFVKTGIVEDGQVEISGDALHAGQSVVTIGAYGLTERTRVTLLKD